MSEVVGEAIVELRTDDKAVAPGATKAGEQAGQASAKGYKKSFGSGLKNLWTSIGPAIGVAAAVGLVKSSIGEAREAQKVAATTSATIKATGGAAGITAKHIGDLATSISNKAGMDDEMIQSGENVLLTFKKIRNEAGAGNDAFDRATKAAVDLSASGFGSVRSASTMLGKALNDPVKGVSALARVGVGLSGSQTDLVKKLVKSGHTLKAQKIILKAVEGQVGGTAEATATSGDKMAVAWGNLQEQLGTALLPVVDAIATVLTTAVIPAVSTLITALGTLVGFVKDNALWFELAAGALALLLAPIILAVTWLGLMAAATWIQTTAITAYNAVVSFAAGVTNAWRIAIWLMNAAWAASPIGVIIVAVLILVGVIILLWKHSETFRKVTKAVWAAVQAAVSRVVDWFKGPFASFFTKTLPNFFRSAWERVKTIVRVALRVLLILIGGWPLLVYAIIRKFGPQIAALFRNAWERARGAVSAGISAIRNLINGIPGMISSLAGRALSAGKHVGSSIIGGIMAGLRGAAGFVSDLASSIRSAINSALHLPVHIKGPGPLPDFSIPAFAAGTFSAPGGLAVVGEHGPEVVNLPRGSRVHPNSEGGGFPKRLVLRIGARDFIAYVEEIADSRVDAADALAWQGA